jgi:hypothetical protein
MSNGDEDQLSIAQAWALLGVVEWCKQKEMDLLSDETNAEDGRLTLFLKATKRIEDPMILEGGEALSISVHRDGAVTGMLSGSINSIEISGTVSV